MLYEIIVPQSKKMLQNLINILDKGVNYSELKKFDFEILLGTRLAPDQFPLLRQVQIACDTAKHGASRLTGKEAPFHDDKEKTWPELRARIESVMSYLDTYAPGDFAGSEERHVSQPRWEGKYLNGFEFATQHVLPNMYFHITTAYSILRSHGVDVGKKDYLGPMPYKQ